MGKTFNIEDSQTGAIMYRNTSYINALDLLMAQGLSFREAYEWLADPEMLAGSLRVCGALRIAGV